MRVVEAVRGAVPRICALNRAHGFAVYEPGELVGRPVDAVFVRLFDGVADGEVFAVIICSQGKKNIISSFSCFMEIGRGEVYSL